MKYKYFFLGIVMMCCETKREVDVKGNDEIARVDSILQKYSPLKEFVGNDGTNQNTFLFEREAGWDTTYVLAIKKDGSSIIALYQGYSPHYSETTAYYEGAAFAIDSMTWTKIIAGAESLLDTLNQKPYTDCVDCSMYGLSYNSKSTRMSKGNRLEFEKYERFLWSVINPVLVRKRQLNEPKGN